MKNYIYILALVFSVQILAAQEDYNYVPFPEDSAIWKTKCKSNGMDYFTYELYRDTLSQESKLYVKTDHEIEICPIRVYDKRVWITLPDLGRHLLYDFSLVENSIMDYTVYGIVNGNSVTYEEATINQHHFSIVEKIDSVQLSDGSKRKRWHLRTYFNYVKSFDEWIEGIGSTNGLLTPFFANRPLGGKDSYFLSCFSHNDTTYIGDCSILPISETAHSNVIFYPNPITNMLMIESKEDLIKQISLFDLQGQQLENINNINSGEYKLNLRDYAAGTYLLRIQNIGGNTVVETIIKQP